jgi:hypothetical protein
VSGRSDQSFCATKHLFSRPSHFPGAQIDKIRLYLISRRATGWYRITPCLSSDTVTPRTHAHPVPCAARRSPSARRPHTYGVAQRRRPPPAQRARCSPSRTQLQRPHCLTSCTPTACAAVPPPSRATPQQLDLHSCHTEYARAHSCVRRPPPMLSVAAGAVASLAWHTHVARLTFLCPSPPGAAMETSSAVRCAQ